jgi:hypothetical protein
MLFKQRPLLGIFLLAFAARLAWVLTLGPTMLWADEREFAMVASIRRRRRIRVDELPR